MNVLSDIAAASAIVTDRAGPAVVSIGRNARGAGVVIAEGRVLTNAHNLRDRTTTVTFVDGRSEQGTVAGLDVDGDLAVLTVDTSGVIPLEWPQDAPVLRPGTPVFALANAGGRGLRATFGTVSAVNQTFRGPRGRRIAGAVEHTAPLGRGSSGGPTLDIEGRLIGINTNRLGDGFYLAIPADSDLRARVDALGRGESPTRLRLGVGLAPARVANRLRRAVGLPERDGLLVQHVEEASPADRAGLRQGDLLVEAAGRPLSRADDLLDTLEGLEAEASLALGVVRGVEELSVSVRFGSQEGGAEGAM
ncbi:MAG: PDZ domain-containing protein [Nitriliruptorales bacterium]|nr:PDZ domain-containing protein [Nitriliruptorales bacterium]